MPLFFEDYEAIEIGHAWRSASREITQDDILRFADLTGDTHPQHVDIAYGAQSAYGATIAHGFLTVSLAAGLIYRLGFDETAAHAILGLNWRLPRPVLPGDVIHVDLTLTARRASRTHPALGIVERRYDVRNQSGETVAVGDVAMLIKRRESR